MAMLLQLAELAEQMAATASRLAKRSAIAQAIAAVHHAAPQTEDAGLFAMYLAGTPFAESDPRKLNAGGALLSKAILAVSGATDAALTAAYRRHGDLGAAAFDLLAPIPPTPATLTLADIAEAFAAMAAVRTTAARAALVENLLRRATPPEAKYLLKLMLGDMRIGVKQSLVEEAIAEAAAVPVAAVRHAVMLEADLASAVRRAFAGTLSEARMRLFHPLGFMLASPVDSPEEAVARFASNEERTTENGQRILAFLEDKYDGMRAQLHCGDPDHPGRVALYSRNREDITASFPELAEAFAHVDPVTDGPLILDGEILAWDFGSAQDVRVPHPSRMTGVPGKRSLLAGVDSEGWDVSPPTGLTREVPHALPFAVLGQRIGRKRVSNEWRARVPVIFMAFDLLYAGGELTLNLPLRDRRNRLEAVVDRLTPLTVSPSRSTSAPTSRKPASSNGQRRTSNGQLPSLACCSRPRAWRRAPQTSTAPTSPPAPAPTRAS